MYRVPRHFPIGMWMSPSSKLACDMRQEESPVSGGFLLCFGVVRLDLRHNLRTISLFRALEKF